MMHDSGLKDQLFKHYWAQRYFAQPEVKIFCDEGIEPSPKEITDVDVYALRPHPDLYFERLLGDCRTLKGQSPISRSLWLRGLIDLVDAHSGCVLLETPRIERDHKLAASQIRVTLLSGADFKAYDRSLVYPDGSDKIGTSISHLRDLRDVSKKFPKLEPLLRYLYVGAWQDRSFGSLIRHLIGNLKHVNTELDPSRTDHLAVVADAAAVLSIGIAECAGKIFHQYLHPPDKGLLSEALKLLLWGGHETYVFHAALRQRLMSAKGLIASEDPGSLELPEWNLFVQLVRHVLDRPKEMFVCPWLLRQFAVDILTVARPFRDLTKADLLALKFSMLTVEYACRAAGLPRQFNDVLTDALVRGQSDLVSGMSRAAPAASVPVMNLPPSSVVITAGGQSTLAFVNPEKQET